MSDNRIKMLKGGAFRGCLTVQTLRMARAGIRIIQPNALDDLVSVAEVDLSGNDLLMPDMIFEIDRLASLRHLVLSGNDMSNLTRGVRAVSSYLGDYYMHTSSGQRPLPSLKRLEGLRQALFLDNFSY